VFGTQAAWRIRLASRLILKPTRNPLDASHLQRLVVETRGLKQELYCSTKSLDGGVPDLWFLKIPGSTGRAEKGTSFPAELVAAQSHGKRTAVLTWNPPGYGQSEGKANLKLAAELLPEVVDAVVQNLKWSAVPFFALGTSLGAALAIHLCNCRNVAGIVLCNPPSLPELMPRYNRWWNLWLGGSFMAQSIPSALRTISVAGKTKTPAVLITSMADRVVPPELQKRIAESYAGPLQVLEIAGADHGLRMADIPETTLQPLLNWLLKEAGIETSGTET
jgi:uncharacterized protein